MLAQATNKKLIGVLEEDIEKAEQEGDTQEDLDTMDALLPHDSDDAWEKI
jgi:hypothetical protein